MKTTRFFTSLISAILAGLMVGAPSEAALVDVGWVEQNNFIFENLNPYGNLAGLTLSAAAHKAAFIFRVPKSGSITKVGFRVHAVTVADTLYVGLQTVDGTFSPSGTNYGGSTPGTQAAPAASTVYTVSLAGAATATKGDLVAVVIGYNSYVAGNLSIGVVAQSTFGNGFPAAKLFTASWAASNNSPVFWLEYSDGSYAPLPNVYPIAGTASNSVAFNSGSTPDEYALRFSLPYKARIAGVRPYFSFNTAASVSVILYDSDGSTALTSVVVSSQSASTALRPAMYFFPSAVILSTGTAYRVAIRPDNANDVTVGYFQLPSNAVQAQLGGGTEFYASTRTNAGSWSDMTSYRLPIGLIFDQIDYSAASATSSGSSGDVYPFSWR